MLKRAKALFPCRFIKAALVLVKRKDATFLDEFPRVSNSVELSITWPSGL